MIFVNTLLTAISGRLTNVAPTTLTVRDLANGLVTPHRYVWEPTSIDDATTQRAFRNQNPKLVGTDMFNFAVHCWAATYDDAQAMRLALRQALKEELGARGNFVFGSASWTWPEWAITGYVLSQNVGLLVASVEMVLPTSALDYPAQIAANEYDTVTITAVGNQPATSTAGDGILESGES